MTRSGVLLVLALAWCAPVRAQDAAADPAPAPRDEAPADAEPPPPSSPSATPASTTASGAAASSSGAAQPTVVVRHVDDDEDEEEEEEEPQDRGDPYDILWIELFGGASYVDLRAVDTTNYYPEFVRLAGWGPAGGAALGFRVEFFSAGVRAAFAHYDASDASAPQAKFDVGTLVAEVKLALPIPVVQPFVRVGFGLGWHGDSNAEQAWEERMPPSDIQTTVFGWVFEGAIGLDVYLTHWFAIGAAFSVDILNMSRQTWNEEPTNPADVNFRDAGDAVGAQGRGQIAVSFHM